MQTSRLPKRWECFWTGYEQCCTNKRPQKIYKFWISFETKVEYIVWKICWLVEREKKKEKVNDFKTKIEEEEKKDMRMKPKEKKSYVFQDTIMQND